MSFSRSIVAVSRRAYTASSRRMFAADAAPSSASLVVNFCTPYAPIFSDKVVDKVILPGEDGEYGVTAGHSPMISQLKPGVVTIMHTNVRSSYCGLSPHRPMLNRDGQSIGICH